jgi:hypothetical protein
MAPLLHPKTKQEIDFGSLSPSEIDDLYDECKQISQHLAFKIRTSMELNQEIPRKQEDLKAYADRILMRLESLREDRTLAAIFRESLAVLTPTQRSLVIAEYSRLLHARNIKLLVK